MYALACLYKAAGNFISIIKICSHIGCGFCASHYLWYYLAEYTKHSRTKISSNFTLYYVKLTLVHRHGRIIMFVKQSSIV